MKIQNFKKCLVLISVAGMAFLAANAVAQNSSNAGQSAAIASAPSLSYGVPQILQLEQAKVSDSTIIAYIKNSGNSYGLNADQIIYLRQQGVSDAVVNAMLNQPKVSAAAADVSTTTPPAAPTAPTTVSTETASTATVAPTVTYMQTVPTTYYYNPYYYPAYPAYPGYPVYYGYPNVSLAFGFGGRWDGGWHGGGGWHGHR